MNFWTKGNSRRENQASSSATPVSRNDTKQCNMGQGKETRGHGTDGTTARPTITLTTTHTLFIPRADRRLAKQLQHVIPFYILHCFLLFCLVHTSVLYLGFAFHLAPRFFFSSTVYRFDRLSPGVLNGSRDETDTEPTGRDCFRVMTLINKEWPGLSVYRWG